MDTILVPVDVKSASGIRESLTVAAAQMEKAGWPICADDIREMSDSLHNAMIAAGVE